MALVVMRVEILAVPAGGKVNLHAHLVAELLGELDVVLAGVKADVADCTVGVVARVVCSI